MIKKTTITTLILLTVGNYILFAQNSVNINKLKSNFVKSENKQKYYSNLIDTIENALKSDVIRDSKFWTYNLRNAQSIFYYSATVKSGIEKALSLAIDKDVNLQRAALEMAFTFDEISLVNKISNIIITTKDPVSFAISALYLNKFSSSEFQYTTILKLLSDNFPNYKNNYIINTLIGDLDSSYLPKSRADFRDLLLHEFQKGKTIVYSIHRKDRRYPGITIIKDGKGNFLKNDDGSLFYIPQLALSFSNLPSYIPNGNTPQGIFSIIGTYISPTETIGPTPNLLTRIPFEVSPNIFYHGKNLIDRWNIDEYRNLIPKSWQDYSDLYESYHAGRTGRKLIIIHGSTDELKYFDKNAYYPLTPTRGCLSSIEIWNEEDGTCLKSDQSLLINKFRSTKSSKGFLVVIELDDQKKGIEITEIESILKN